MAITIRFLADVADWVRGLGTAEKALSENEEGLEDLMRQAVDLGRQIGKSTDDIAKDFSDAFGIPLDRAKRAVEEVVDETDDLGDKATEAGKKVGKGLGDAATDVGDKMSEMGSIARDVLEGDFSSAASSASSAIGGIGSAIGGLPGLIAGVVGAGGFALLSEVIAGITEQQQLAEEQVKAWTDTYISEGSKMLSFASLQANALSILNDRHKELTDNTRDWGVSEEIALAAMSGSPSAIDAVTDALGRKKDAAADDAKVAQEAAEAAGGQLLALTPLEESYRRGAAALDALNGSMSEGQARADLFSSFIADAARQTQGATEAIDEFGDSIITLPDGKQVYIDAETGQATMDTDAIEKKIYGIQDKTVSLGLDASGAYASLAAFRASVQRRLEIPVALSTPSGLMRQVG